MDVILLNEQFLNEEYVDNYESFIWREAYFGGDGDFELTFNKIDSDASPMAIGRILTHSETNRMCVVDTLEEEEDDDGVVMITWKGVDFTRWVFSRRVVQRTVMPTYKWTRSPHSSSSVQLYKGVEQERQQFINPHFVTSDEITPFRNVGGSADPKEAISGHLRVGNGVVAISGVTADNTSYRGFGYKMARQRLTNPTTSRQFTFSFSVSDVHLSAGGRVIVVMDFFNSRYQKIESMYTDSPAITADGRYQMTTPLHSFAPTFYDVTFIVDNRLNTKHASITDCGATFHSPRLKDGNTAGEFFAGDLSYLMLHPERKFSGLASDIMNDMIQEITRNNTDNPNDNIETSPYFPTGLDGYELEPKNPLPAETVDLYFGSTNLYEALLDVGQTYDMGVSIMRDLNGALYAYAHGGTDRRHKIVYDAKTDTLNNPSSLETIRDRRTHAVVYGKYDFVITDAYGSVTDHNGVSGFNRELLVVDANDVDLPHDTEELYSLLIQRGREALNEHQRVVGIDGEVPPHVPYVYQRDFGLGSMVTVKNDNGGVAEMRVTEYIFVSDAEGYRSYPTLSKNRYIDPGTWEAVPSGENWTNTPGYWGTR